MQKVWKTLEQSMTYVPDKVTNRRIHLRYVYASEEIQGTKRHVQTSFS